MACGVGSIIVVIANLILSLAGLAVMIFGIISLADPQLIVNGLNLIPGFENVQYIINVQQALINSGVLLTVVGGVIFLVCFVGMFGACMNSKCLLGSFVLSVFIILLFEIAVIIYSCVAYTLLESRVQALMYSSLVLYFQPVQISGTTITPSTTPGGQAWETLQFTYGCCGAHNYTDFANFPWANNFTAISVNNARVPPSCCTEQVQYEFASNTGQFSDLSVCLAQPPMYTNTKGCYIAMLDMLSQNDHVIILIVASLIAIEVIIMMLSMHLISVEKSKNRVGV